MMSVFVFFFFLCLFSWIAPHFALPHVDDVRLAHFLFLVVVSCSYRQCARQTDVFFFFSAVCVSLNHERAIISETCSK